MSFKHLRNVNGFLSDYYLGSVFGRGQRKGRRKSLSDKGTDAAYTRFRRLWERSEGRVRDASACRERFMRPFLRDVLGFHLGAGEDRIHPLFATAEEEHAGEKPLVIAYLGDWDEDLDLSRGRLTPAKRVEQALARLSLKYGLVLTGERARLVRVPGEGPRGAYIEADLAALAEEEDTESFAVLLRLFSADNFKGDSQGNLPIERIEEESRKHAERVSTDLKQAVFAAAEALVSGLIADAVSRGDLASPLDLDEKRLLEFRDAALLALYRILFALYAEARDPRLTEHSLYWSGYSVQGLVDEILQHPGREWPENRCSMWQRLLALFRVYDEGLPPIDRWENIPPRGSNFFSRTTEEGRILDRARLPDRVVAELLLDIATAAPRHGVGRERISFRELDIEQLGAVYEGLLEYEPRIVRETSLLIRVQGKELVLTPADTVRLCRQKGLRLKGDPAFVRGTKAETWLAEPAQDEEDEEEETPGEVNRVEDEEEPDNEEDGATREEGIRKGATATVVRRLEPGTFHFVPGPGRKGSGSYYTPRPLVQDIVRHALGPLVEGKTAAEMESLRVLDPACGSAHFLVEAMRFLGQALHRAYVKEYGGKAPPEFTATGSGWDEDWRATDEEARAANSEARAWCKRRIAERCLFGVDLNPTAVQLARVALWIESVAGDRPLTFFEHHIRCGNSLLGTWMERLERAPLPKMDTNGSRKQERLPLQDSLRQAIREAAKLRRTIDEVRHEDLRREGIDPESLEEQRYKSHLLGEANETLTAAKFIFNLRSASAFVPEIWAEWDSLTVRAHDINALTAYARSRPWWEPFEETCRRERFFHWELEFPEVFVDPERPGFDAVLGNPPWDKIKPDRKEFYGRYDVLIRAFVGGELDQRIRDLQGQLPGLAAEFGAYEKHVRRLAACLKQGGDYRYQDWEVDGKTTGGDPDAFRFFVERAWQLAREGGRVGFVVPSAIYNNEGCTGLRHLLLDEAQVERFYAFENRKKVFPIHSSYKFVSLVFRKGKPDNDGFEAAFMRHELEELDSTAQYREPGQERVARGLAPWVVPVRKRELERLSPGTLAFLEYRSPRDRESLLKMYGYDSEGNPVNPRPLLGDHGPGTWNARFYTEFHMTNDRDLWTDPATGKLYNPRQVLGPVSGTTTEPPYYDPGAWPEIRARMAEAGFWPLYEGKHIEQFLVDIKPIERWVNLEACEEKYGSFPDGAPKLVFRDIARNTDERTCIAAVLPEKSCAGNTLAGIESKEVTPDIGATLLNSLPVDFAIRLRTASTHLNFTYMTRLAVLDSFVSRSLPCVATASASPGMSHISELRDHWVAIWISNRAIAEAYGLMPEELVYMLGAFPVFARKRPEFHTYLLNRLHEWAEETCGSRIVLREAAGDVALAKVAESSAAYGDIRHRKG